MALEQLKEKLEEILEGLQVPQGAELCMDLSCGKPHEIPQNDTFVLPVDSIHRALGKGKRARVTSSELLGYRICRGVVGKFQLTLGQSIFQYESVKQCLMEEERQMEARENERTKPVSVTHRIVTENAYDCTVMTCPEHQIYAEVAFVPPFDEIQEKNGGKRVSSKELPDFIFCKEEERRRNNTGKRSYPFLHAKEILDAAADCKAEFGRIWKIVGGCSAYHEGKAEEAFERLNVLFVKGGTNGAYTVAQQLRSDLMHAMKLKGWGKNFVPIYQYAARLLEELEVRERSKPVEKSSTLDPKRLKRDKNRAERRARDAALMDRLKSAGGKNSGDGGKPRGGRKDKKKGKK